MGCWVELIYEAGLLEALARPVLRCVTTDGMRDQILPGPIFGRAFWIGFIPFETHEIHISPTDQRGWFSFRIASLRRLYVGELIRRSRRWKCTIEALYGNFLSDSFFTERNFQRSVMATPLKHYAKWRNLRRRRPEWSGLDSLKADPKAPAPHIRIIAPDADHSAVAHWLSVLEGQPWPHWSLVTPAGFLSTTNSATLSQQTRLHETIVDLGSEDLIAVVEQQDTWAPETLAIVGSAACRDSHDLFFGDEEVFGKGVTPLFKPEWSPIAGQNVDWLGRGWFARAGWARSTLGDQFVKDIPKLRIQPSDRARFKHIARVLVSRPDDRLFETNVVTRQRPSRVANVTIIIPIRDRIDLLKRCVISLSRTQVNYEVIIVDNGSIEPETIPGPFNYSALCNDAAKHAQTEILVFLNNDTEVVSSNWLENLTKWTLAPTIGAVGAKLIFPDGRLQHVGVIVGIDGHANHYELAAGQNGAGYFRRLQVPHELSAVTGACLAVEKKKFDAVEGFDAENLPVEFNDIDLCLRLGERGWRCLLNPDVVLIHRQAATRSTSRNQELRYAAEVRFFKNRWRHRLRADPFFHPALSLDWHGPALG
jgi:GT2 family glycosyltransferase